jgi:hypothetical protein
MTSFDWLALMIFINVKILAPHVANKVTMGNEMQHFGALMSPTILHFSHFRILPPFVMHGNSPQLPLLCTNIASNRDETYNKKTTNIVLVTIFSSKSYPQLWHRQFGTLRNLDCNFLWTNFKIHCNP